MSRAWWVGIVVVLAGAGAVAVTKWRRPPAAPLVQVESAARHDLVSTVTATGQLEPHTKVDVIADVAGRVITVGVREGDVVTKGQFLVQIDPSQPKAAVDRAQANVGTANAALEVAKTNAELADRQFQRTKSLQTESPSLVADDEIDRLESTAHTDRSLLASAEHAVDEAQAALREAQSALDKTRVAAPMSGRVTRLSVAEGSMAITGEFNRDAATLLTISDMSVLETKVLVREGDVSKLDLGDSASVSLDAVPDSAYPGKIVSISHSSARDPSGAASTASSSGDAGGAKVVNYEVTVQLARAPAKLRPDFSARATMIAAVRRQVVAVPLIALAIRDAPRAVGGDGPRTVTVGSIRPRDEEGVFVLGPGNTVRFRPVTVGITGDTYVEVLDGLNAGERIVTGPYETIKNLRDGAIVRMN